MKCIKTQLAGASKYEDQEDQNTGDGKLSSRQLTDTCLSLSLSLSRSVCLSLFQYIVELCTWNYICFSVVAFIVVVVGVGIT